MVKGDWIKPGAAVIDVGINRIAAPEARTQARPATAEGLSTMPSELCPLPAWITPAPGGVGPMTIACLLANTVTTASLINGLTPPATSHRKRF